ncbi:vacuolar protein sorting-associated protein 72 homolog [Tigriopus californicus]|uniref:vacuolar protein sorting-associated protein 72 homolog n=1 Tax=Tigriopus californicus TaxID=6832 RepID=UPI0027DA6785|nr:vacuolar protein sorting-associated protein 72 homolog [Tigriopus californicus]
MALARARRSNAGAKMASLLNEEEKALMKDDFYSTQYGGFNEEADDVDFQAPAHLVRHAGSHEVIEDDDEVDSDFSIDENDEPKSDLDEEAETKKAKRGQGVQTKAYREPVKRVEKAAVVDPAAKKARQAQRIQSQIKRQWQKQMVLTDFGRKEARASTVSKTAETQNRQKEREHRARKLLRQRMRAREKKKANEREPTQAELLAEAKLTERLNIATLKKYEEMELEARKKATKLTQRTITGPYVRFLSTAMPMVSEVRPADERIVVDEPLEEAGPNVPSSAPTTDETARVTPTGPSDGQVSEPMASSGRQARTFLTFSDFDSFRRSFPSKRPRHSQQKMCPITRLPAKYFDPATRLPYANLHAFRILREAYYSQLEQKGNKNDPEVKAWLDWRQKHRPTKPTLLTQVSRTPSAFSHLLNPASTPVTPNPALVQRASVNIGGGTVQLPPRAVTTTLTAQQLQQLSRGQVLSSALHNALRGNSPRAQIVTRPSQGITAQGLAAGQQILRTQTGLTQQPQTRLQQPTIAIHRPSGSVVVTSGSNHIPTTFAVAVASQPQTLRATNQGIAIQHSSSNNPLRTVGNVVSTGGGQQIVVAQPGGQGRIARQIVMSQAGGTPVRGQILQVTNQAGGHQFVVSTNAGGQYLINQQHQPTSKP